MLVACYEKFCLRSFSSSFHDKRNEVNHLTQINRVIIYMHKGGKISSQNGKGYITTEVDSMDLPDFGN